MKKEYMKPNMKVLELKTKLQLLAGSYSVDVKSESYSEDLEDL